MQRGLPHGCRLPIIYDRKKYKANRYAPFADGLAFRLAVDISKAGLSSGFAFAKVEIEEQSLRTGILTSLFI
jgi:hypothetical protein